MKRIGIISSVIVFALISVFTLSSFDQQAAAKIKFDKLVHDYGVMHQGDDGKCEFTLTNTGNDMLFITQVIKSCGCTTPEYSKEPVPPGGTSVIKVGYNTNLLGKFEKTITVQSNAETHRVTLKIKGEVVAPEK